MKVFILIIATTLLLSGCRSTKVVVNKPSKKDMELLESLVVDKPGFQNLSSKVDFKFSTREGISTGMKGSIKLSKDSLMILSLQPFAGIEIAKCLIRPDSFFVVSRLHKVYASESVKNLPYSSLGLFDLLQKVLTNRMFIPGKAHPDSRDLGRFAWQKESRNTRLSLTQHDYALDYTLNDDQQYCMLRAYTSQDSDNIQVDYSRFEKTNGFKFPHYIEVNSTTNDKKLNVQITFLKPDFDQPTDIGFPISSKYIKVSLNELIKRFQNML